MKVSEDKRDIFNNVIAGGILIHYGAAIANFVFFSDKGWAGFALNGLSVVIWIVIAIRLTK
jgi:hypothetical protein